MKNMKFEVVNLTNIGDNVFNGVVENVDADVKYLFTTSLKKIKSGLGYIPSWITLKRITEDGLMDVLNSKLKEKLYKAIYTSIQTDINKNNEDDVKVEWVILLLKDDSELLTEILGLGNGIDWEKVTVRELVEKFHANPIILPNFKNKINTAIYDGNMKPEAGSIFDDSEMEIMVDYNKCGTDCTGMSDKDIIAIFGDYTEHENYKTSHFVKLYDAIVLSGGFNELSDKAFRFHIVHTLVEAKVIEKYEIDTIVNNIKSFFKL